MPSSLLTLLNRVTRRNTEWSPASLGPAFYWPTGTNYCFSDAAKTAKVADAGQVYTQAETVTGADLVQATSKKRPLYDGTQRALRFDGTDDFIGRDPVVIAQPFTVAFRASFRAGHDGVNNNAIFSLGDSRSVLRSSGGQLWLYFGNLVNAGTAPAINTPFTVVAYVNGGSSYLRVNGTQTNGSAGANGGLKGTFGAQDFPVPNSYASCFLADPVVYSGALSAPNLALLETYYSTRF